MQQCKYCGAPFTNQDAYHIHLGVGAPAFHACNDADTMREKGMTQDRSGAWLIDKSLIVHHQGWASLRSDWAPGHLPKEQAQ